MLPVLFISHGSPEIAVKPTAAHDALRAFGRTLDKPVAILCISAHWETQQPAVAINPAPATIYDFAPQFDARLRDITYRAAGAPQIAHRAADLITERTGLEVWRDDQRGRDHGVWTPLHLLFPDQDVPVSQLSIQPHQGPQHHYEMGRALAPLRSEDVLIVASGALTHNLSAFRGRPVDAAQEPWVLAFRDWMYATLTGGRTEALLDYRAQAPNAVDNHPEDEHLLPIFCAVGAGMTGGASGTVARWHASVEYGVIAMDCYRFG